MPDLPVHDCIAGETVTHTIASPLGSDTSDYGCTATLRRQPGGVNARTALPTVALTPTVVTFAGDATRGPGWQVPQDTTTLKAGIYHAYAPITHDGTTVETIEWLLAVRT